MVSFLLINSWLKFFRLIKQSGVNSQLPLFSCAVLRSIIMTSKFSFIPFELHRTHQFVEKIHTNIERGDLS